MFPQLKDKTFGYVNLDIEAQRWRTGIGIIKGNPLLDPITCEQMVSCAHRQYGLDYSYGGWMEDRRHLWAGSYLEDGKKFIHLGVDFNVPHRTDVALDFDARVLMIDDDYDEQHGWGPRVIVRHLDKNICLIYAHLDQITCNIGDVLFKGEAFSVVGSAPYNGNWYPHLHVQCVDLEYMNRLLAQHSLDQVDGYGSSIEINRLAVLFPDPLRFVTLI